MGSELKHEMNSRICGEMDKAGFDESETVYEGKDKAGCSAVGYQDVNVCIPVTIKPFGEVGNAKTKCVGKAVVSSGCGKCMGKPGDVCQFTISQKLRVEVPVVFGARAEVGETSIDCGCAESIGNGMCEQ